MTLPTDTKGPAERLALSLAPGANAASPASAPPDGAPQSGPDPMPSDGLAAYRFAAQFTLSRADALAWETRPRELSAHEKLILFSLIALGGATYGATEERLPVWFLLLHPIAQFALIAGVGFALWRLGLRGAAYLRAARRSPALCRFEDCGDHFTYAEGARTRQITPESVLAVTATDRHIVLSTPDLAVLLPLTAFPDRKAAQTCADQWQRRVDLAAAPD